jgi:plastocyanin
MRRRYIPLAAVLGAAAAVLPTVASSETTPAINALNEPGGVYSEEHHRWSPAQATVAVGGTVTFSNSTEIPHGVHWIGPPATPVCEEGAGKVPVGTEPKASGTKWSGACTFSQPGTYTFYCTVHGPEMTGTVTVLPSGTTTPSTTTPTTTSTSTTPTTPTETPAESPLLGSPSLRSSQRGGVVKGSLEISKVGVGDRLEIDLFAKQASLAKSHRQARVRVGRLVRGSVPAGKLSFAVKLDAKARKALAHRRRLALSVRITLTPTYGESLTVTRAVVVRQ